MALPYFFVESLVDKTIQLDEDTSKHMIGVLRMNKGEDVLLTDGKGQKAKATITDDNRKRCVVQIQSIETEEESKTKVSKCIVAALKVSRLVGRLVELK